jgi:2-polyprenyl-6-methoxyphenol hydroxylase-like FAD-dependent oxidoreductase
MLHPQRVPSIEDSVASVPNDPLPIVVIGAGPVGLAAAAHLLERGLEPLVLEAGPSVGHHLLDYGHVQLFSPWRYSVDAAMERALAKARWQRPPHQKLPTAREVVDGLLRPFADLPSMRSRIQLRTRVTSISREGFDKVKTEGRERAPFVICAEHNGQAIELRARAVIDASGTWGRPNPLGANGLPAFGESENAQAIFYGIPDVLGAQRARYAGMRTLVVGAGHSAANALLALAQLAQSEPRTRLVWSVRTPKLERVFGAGAADQLAARGALGAALKALRDSDAMQFVAGLRIASVRRDGTQLVVAGHGPDGQPMRLEGIDQIICATGQRPDLGFTGELRLKLDPWLESSEALGPLIDPNLHSCGTVRPHGHRELSHPEPGFYTLGVKSYGRAPTFLMATGYEQARSVAAALAGDIEAADRVELELPETGVCSVAPGAAGGQDASACCGGPPKGDAANACCALDEAKKAEGAAGCGCATVAVAATPRRSACCG